MKIKTFAVPYMEDGRMKYAKEYLERCSYHSVCCVDDADFILLPLSVKKAMLQGLEDKIVFLGMGDYDGCYDYYKNENFVLKNAFLTAEGAVALAEESTDFSLYRSKILITGYGRIGKALHHCLKGFGADITICSRSEISKSEALFNGASHIYFEQLCTSVDYNIIFNTVPHLIFTKPELDSVRKDAVIIDLASFPGGVDTLYSGSLGIKVIDGKRIPMRYAVKTAGEMIGETVAEIIEEELS